MEKITNEKGTYSLQSFLIHGKHWTEKWDFSHHLNIPMSSSTSYKLDSIQRGAKGFMDFGNPKMDKVQAPIYIYDRMTEPTRGVLEENLARVEGGECAVTFSSGMAAVSAAICNIVKSGDEIIAHKTLYGCTFSLFTNWLPRFNVTVKLEDLQPPETLKELITEKTRVVYFETPANPTLELIDMAAIIQIVQAANVGRTPQEKIEVIVDNTFATPYCQRPISMGADMVIHSLSKNISGFGTDLGGVVIGPKEFESSLLLYRKDFGGVLSSKSAWSILIYGLSTLGLRLDRQMKNAALVAEYLNTHPEVERVNYPGLKNFPQYEIAKKQMIDLNGEFAPGNMIYFELKSLNEDLAKRTERFINFIAENSYVMTLAVSLGQTRTLIETPGLMTHAMIPPEKQKEAGISVGGIRMSVGLENADDIIADMAKALSA